jgi:NitT/TauT family transport system ATP-binding protein
VSKTFRVRGGGDTPDHLLPVLRHISFDVQEGEIVSLIGESGCGKTTLLRIVQGLIKHDAGTISVDGAPVSGPGRDRGFVFQQATLLPWRSARQNVEFGLELQGIEKAKRREKAQTLLELVGLGRAGVWVARDCSIMHGVCHLHGTSRNGTDRIVNGRACAHPA